MAQLSVRMVPITNWVSLRSWHAHVSLDTPPGMMDDVGPRGVCVRATELIVRVNVRVRKGCAATVGGCRRGVGTL
jgi:hypothetical protein